MYYNCQICNREVQHSFIKSHLINIHNLCLENYYQTYVNPNFNNICFCGKTKPFIKLSRPYDDHCSRNCAIKYYHKVNPGKLMANIDFSAANKEMKRIHGARIAEINSKRCVERLRDPNDNFGKRKGTRSYYNNIFMRSSWEVEFAQLCDQHNIEWQYEPKTFYIGKSTRYTPDFFLNNYNKWVEIKPKRLHTEFKERIKLEFINLISIEDFNRFIHEVKCE